MFETYVSTLQKSEKIDFPPVTRPKDTPTDDRDPDYHSALIFDHAAHNSFYMPVIMERGEGPFLWDVSGKKYLDFLSAFCSVNQGHCNPKILEALVEQSGNLTQTGFICAND
jgi:ornithine--oxo-acid transaminase